MIFSEGERLDFSGLSKGLLPGCPAGLYSGPPPPYLPPYPLPHPLLPSWCLHSLLLQSQASLLHQLQLHAAQSGQLTETI
jgi:hypothetical protein